MADPQRSAAEAAFTARLAEREAMRRAAAELNATTPAGLEGAMSRISAEVTAEAAERKASERLKPV